MELYEHQKKRINELPEKHAFVWACGSGKTRTVIEMAKKTGLMALVISPKSLRENWRREIIKWEAPCYQVISKEEFRRDWDKLDNYQIVIVDECFLKGTKVLTPSGYRNIESIKKGDKVINILGEQEVTNTSKRQSDEIYKIKLSNGEILNVTGNHPLFTSNGWKFASELSTSSVLLHYLHGTGIINKYEMSKLQKPNTTGNSGENEEVLFSTLCEEISLEEKKKRISRFAKKGPQGQTLESREFIKENDRKQPDEREKNKKKSVKNIKKNRAQTKDTRRKWEGDSCPCKSLICSVGAWLGARISNYNGNGSWYGLSALLQGGHRESVQINCDRSGWPFTWNNKKKKLRQKKGFISKRIRVESIEIQKQGSNGKFKQGFEVYNLEISGHPSYVVSDIIVHNCHYFLGTKSQMMKSLKKYFKKHDTKYRWLLSATPYRSSPMDIYILASLLGVYISYNGFQQRFFNFVPMGRGRRIIPVPKKDIEEDIAALVRQMGSVVRLEDCVDVPEQTFETEYFEATKEQIKGVENIEDILPIVKYTKEHQICGGTLKGDEYNEGQVFRSNKMDRLMDIIMDNRRLIVVCRYNNEIDHITEAVENSKTDKKVRIIRGDVKDRDAILEELKDSEDYVLLVNAACSEGWQLPKCPLMVFYSYGWSLVQYVQMKGRIQRIDNIKKNVYLSLITKDSVDEAVYQSIMNKEDFHVEIYAKKN